MRFTRLFRATEVKWFSTPETCESFGADSSSVSVLHRALPCPFQIRAIKQCSALFPPLTNRQFSPFLASNTFDGSRNLTESLTLHSQGTSLPSFFFFFFIALFISFLYRFLIFLPPSLHLLYTPSLYLLYTFIPSL